MPPKANTAAPAATKNLQPGQNSADTSIRPPPQVPARSAFYFFLAANTFAAIFSPIQDCDEVFNYWEPTHYLNHGYGLQTWEYSPDYAIRSWAYTGLHAVVIQLGQLLPFVNSKVGQFNLLRMVLALVCALCETKLYSTISRTINPRTAIFFQMIIFFSPGMYHASIAYLPSSFAMYTTMLGFSAFMDWSNGMKTAKGIFWFAVGALLGWPFAGALVLPFIFEEVFLAVVSGEIFAAARRLTDGALRSLALLAFQIGIDTFFYRKFVCVPLNIVLYNVFSSGTKGPNIYGVEPWHFYLRNLFLNFNLWFILALFAAPLILLQTITQKQAFSYQVLLRGLTFTAPFYLWLAIFTLQPHKEERFMYPAYPALAFNAATALHIALGHFGSTDPSSIFSRIPAKLKLAVVSTFVLASLNAGMLRAIGTMTAFSAPLSVYGGLQKQAALQNNATVCLGKEWYRFPSSYHLPSGIHAKFIKSEFAGLLPGEFNEETNPAALSFPGTWTIPEGMNDENLEDPGKYTPLDSCTYLIDSTLPSSPPSAIQPNFIADSKTWTKLSCRPFLDTAATPLLGRLIWVPDLPFVPARMRRVWGEYCLLQRRV